MAKYDISLRAFVRLDKGGFPTSQIVYRKIQPKYGKWRELSATSTCCTTTTTTTSTTTTTTTTV